MILTSTSTFYRSTAIVSFLWILLCHSPISAQTDEGGLDTLPTSLIFSNLTATVIEPGAWEAVLFHGLTTEKYTPAVGQAATFRSSSLQQVLQVWHNPFRTNRFNLGVDLRYGHANVDQDESRGPLRVLAASDENSTAYHAFTALGVRTRFIPFATLPELNLQAGLLFPLAGELASRQALGWDRTTAFLQGVFYQQLQPWFYLFLQGGGLMQFSNKDREQTSYAFPVGLYPVFVLQRDHWYLFPALDFVTSYNSRFGGGLRRTNTQLLGGLGVQYAPAPAFSINVLWQRLLARGPAPVAVVAEKGSFNQVSVGVRWLVK